MSDSNFPTVNAGPANSDPLLGKNTLNVSVTPVNPTDSPVAVSVVPDRSNTFSAHNVMTILSVMSTIATFIIAFNDYLSKNGTIDFAVIMGGLISGLVALQQYKSVH